MLGSSDEQGVSSGSVSRRRTAISREDRERREPRVSRRMVRSSTSRREVPAPKPEIDPNVIIESRKAPTPLAADREVEVEKRKKATISFVILALGVGASAVIGFTDGGQINVEETIEARNERIRNNQANEQDVISSTIEVPVQDTDSVNKVDGGLLGRGTGGQTPVSTDVASSTATSTDTMASSTEAIASTTEAVVEGNEAEAQPQATPQEETTESEVTQ